MLKVFLNLGGMKSYDTLKMDKSIYKQKKNPKSQPLPKKRNFLVNPMKSLYSKMKITNKPNK